MDKAFFNAHHSPIGAFASFTLGYPGASGGLGLELAGPANQNVYIGLQNDEGQFQMLPFFTQSENFRNNFESVADKSNSEKKEVFTFKDDDISRDYHLGSDKWTTGDLSFTIFSPVHGVPDPSIASKEELEKALLPAVFAEITIDNSNSTKARKAIFGFQGNDPYSSMRQIENINNGGIVGIGQGRMYAICSDSKNVRSGLAFSIEELAYPQNEENIAFGLGKVGALLMTAAPGKKMTWRFAICFYRGGIISAGTDTSYFYSRFFKSIEEVAHYALSHFEEYKQSAIESNIMIDKADLSEEKKFMLTHAIRSYYGSTELLSNNNGGPLWVVNEGEYRMINTLDLTVDQLFYEMEMNPWTVRNVLDTFVENYSYVDKVCLPENPQEYPGGISFTHDMGVANTFSAKHQSSYEHPGLNGVFSFMTHEQLVNWVLCAGVYFSGTDDIDWLKKNSNVLSDCLESMINRDHWDPQLRDGVMDLDTSLVQGGSEITTYDNVDNALGQARRNTYLAVKCWAAYISLCNIFTTLHMTEQADQCEEQTELCVKTILDYQKPDGTIPAILEEDNQSLIIPIIEGLIFTYITNQDLTTVQGPFGDFITALKYHCEAILNKGICLFEDGGWRLSSKSYNSWLSKTYLCQFIADKILGIPIDNTADQAHAQWLLDPENAYFAWSDQMCKGKVCGSRYYPRGVTSILWLA